MVARVVHKLDFELPSRIGTTRVYIKCMFEPVGVMSNLLFVESKKLVTCKRCLKKMKRKDK